MMSKKQKKEQYNNKLVLFLSAAFLGSLPAVPLPMRVDVDRIPLALTFPLGPALTLLLGPQDHVSEGHEHLPGKSTTTQDNVSQRFLHGYRRILLPH